jgi:uncharacterized protein (TIGR02001 family)
MRSILLLVICVFSSASPLSVVAAQSWGGSVALTNDYFVRGISRSDHGAAVQADLHFASAAGLVGGLFASSVQIAPDEHRNAEVSAFLGYAWRSASPWQARIIASHYAYPWNDSGSQYDYDDLRADVDYQGWLNVSVVYSPNAPRYLPIAGLIGVSATSVEFNFTSPWHHRLAAAAGAGYSEVGGPGGAGYAYWSAGGIYDLAPLAFSLSYIGTTAAAETLYYSASARNRWAATLIWRF